MSQKKTIGIIGGGQLGQMLTIAAKKLGFDVVVVVTAAHSPAAQAGAKEIISNNYDEASLRKLASQVDYLTTEFEEGLDMEVLAAIGDLGIPIFPRPKTLGLIQDKYKQKKFLSEHDVAIGPFAAVTTYEDATALLKEYGGKMVMKTRTGGYDGNGNKVVSSEADIREAFQIFKDRHLYAEKFVPFVKELAVMVAVGLDRSVAVYPVVETVQERNICLEVIAPAHISEEAAEQATDIAYKVATLLDSPGVFGIELFLDKDDAVLLNEIAPRVHNSGHYTIEACKTSQFEQHIRAITGMPLGSTDMLVSSAVMINILGTRDGETKVEGTDQAEAKGHTTVHIYGKSPTKVDRKMGHLTTTADNREDALEEARAARQVISI
jgi:5-(carboxyamino)imidazole ribonucleotide synthase